MSDDSSIQFNASPRRVVLFLCAFSVLVLSNCGSFKIDGDPDIRVHVVYDSPEVQRMATQTVHAVQAYQQSTRELLSHDEREQLAAIAELQKGDPYFKVAHDMDGRPGYDVPRQTRLKILFESNDFPYSKVEFESGPLKERAGWISRESIDDPRTKVM